MAHLRTVEKKTIEDAFQMHSGYVLDFSNKTMYEFFLDEFYIDIYAERYAARGDSKANRLRTLIALESPIVVAKVLRSLWEYRATLLSFPDTSGNIVGLEARLFELIKRLEASGDIASTDALQRFSDDGTLEELISAISRDIEADRPAAALDRLHTYCQKKFGYLLEQRGVIYARDEPLHSRVGKYIKSIEKERELRPVTTRILKSAISVFERFNETRNNASFAHDNDIVDHAEARFIYDSITSILRFVRSLDAEQFGENPPNVQRQY